MNAWQKRELEAFYQESVLPDKMEEMENKIEYFDSRVKFFYKDVSNVKEIIKTLGIDKEQYTKIIEVVGEANGVKPIEFKAWDRVYIDRSNKFVIRKVETYIEERYNRLINSNPRLKNRYSRKVLLLK